MTNHHPKPEPTHELCAAKRFALPRQTLLRWALLFPAVASAFLLSAVAAILLSIPFGFDRSPLVAGPLCAAAWVLTAYLMAPNHKIAVAGIAWLTGAVAAAGLLYGVAPAGHVSHAPFALACAAGLAVLVACLSPRVLLSRIASAATRIAELVNVGRQLINKEKTAMEGNRWVRRMSKPGFWLKLTVALVVLVAGGRVTLSLGRAAVEVVPQQRRGLYLRLGRYIRTLEPGLHLKIPLVDTVLFVSVEERQGYIQHMDAMTQDNVIMRISLQYTYEVRDPRRYRLEVQDPDSIIKQFVEGKMRDVVNTISMSDVMRKRMDLGARIAADLAVREMDYGVHFKLVQIQGTYPPPEVQEAIKQSMVTEQRTVAAREEATQKQITADAALYEAQKQAEAARFKIEETAKAQKASIRMLLEELSKHEALGRKYLEYLIAQELKPNSKWILSGGRVPQLHLGADGDDAP
jgi:regulator of protease activity HflC (stomatin/prohibitin superfamily)